MAESDVEEISFSLVDVHLVDPSIDRVTLPSSFQQLAQEWLGNPKQYNSRSHQGATVRGSLRLHTLMMPKL